MRKNSRRNESNQRKSPIIWSKRALIWIFSSIAVPLVISISVCEIGDRKTEADREATAEAAAETDREQIRTRLDEMENKIQPTQVASSIAGAKPLGETEASMEPNEAGIAMTRLFIFGRELDYLLVFIGHQLHIPDDERYELSHRVIAEQEKAQKLWQVGELPAGGDAYYEAFLGDMRELLE